MSPKLSMRTGIGLLAISALTLAACGGGTAEPDETSEPDRDPGGEATGEPGGGADDPLAELIAAAEAEGQLVWYQTADERIGQRVADAFSEAYDIQVSFNRLNSSQLEQRFSAEMEAGSPAVDVIIPGYATFFDEAVDQGWLTRLSEEEIPEYPPAHLPAEAILEDSGTAIVNITPYVFGYNTEHVSADEAPSTWGDLLDPKWEGRILMSDPTISSVYTAMYYMVEQEYGIEYLEQLGARQPRIFQGAAPMGEALAAGEGYLAVPLPVVFMANLQEEGAPIDWKTMDISIGNASVLGLVSNAPNPNAARLFIHWLLSEEGMEVFTSSEGSINPANLDEWPTEISSPDLDRRAGERQADLYRALGF